MLLVTGSLGGLGMLSGSALDATLATPGASTMPSCHAAMGSHAALATRGLAVDLVPALNWMNGLMLLACVGGCTLLCPPRGNCPSDTLGRFKTHMILSVGMLLGMPLGGQLGGSLLGRLFGEEAGAHLAMLAGMVFGVAAVWPLTTLRPNRAKRLNAARR